MRSCNVADSQQMLVLFCSLLDIESSGIFFNSKIHFKKFNFKNFNAVKFLKLILLYLQNAFETAQSFDFIFSFL